MAPARRPKASRPRLRRRHLTGLTFAAPLIVYLVLFYAYPLAVNVSMSLRRFTRATYVTGEAPFAGADIYQEVLASPQFWPTVEQTAIFVVVSLVFQYTIGLALAVFFYKQLPALDRAARAVPRALAAADHRVRHHLAVDAGRGQRRRQPLPRPASASTRSGGSIADNSLGR